MTHLDPTQTLLRDSLQAFNSRSAGPARLRAVRAAAPHLDRATWRAMADAGWCGVLVPERLGGVGLGPAEAATIALELGRGLAPEPFVACALLPTMVLVPLAGSAQVRDLLACMVDGRCVAALAWQEAAGQYDCGTIALQVDQVGDSLRLSGPHKCWVPLASAADGFIVTASERGAPLLLWVPADTPGIRVTTTRTVDGQTTGNICLQDVVLPAHAVLAHGAVVGEAVAHAIELARLMSAFELIGVLERALESTVAYTKQRVQFGRPIATFQALQHRMVDMWMQGQLSRAAADSALQLVCDQASQDAIAMAVSAAKARAASAGLTVCKSAIHLHGAMGIADETDVGLCLKRSLVLSAWLGNAAWQRNRYLDKLLLQGRVAAPEHAPAAGAASGEVGADMDALPDEEFRQTLAAWIAANYPAHKRFMKKRAFYADISDWYQALSRKGWLAPAWPREHGGMGLSASKQVIYYEELSRYGCARIPDHGIAVGQFLLHHGTPEQIAFFLPRVLSGEHMWCQGYSEPHAGSDLASLRTRAERDGDDLVVTGQKIWTTLAGGANWMFALVRTTKSERSRQSGITFLLIDLRSPGVLVRPIINLKGEGEYFEVFFDGVRVPIANVVGEIDQGWSVANSLLRTERIFFGTPRQCEYALGQLDRLALATDAMQDGGFRARYATLVLDVRDLKSAFESFVGRLRAGEELGSEVSYLKVWGTETYQRITDELVQLAGDHGSQLDDVTIDGIQIDVMNQYLDSRAPAIYSGSNEIQRNILAKQILALPSWAGEKA
jgi:alkylation response protein AidB-like acyl-CoA dehydrogenase